MTKEQNSKPVYDLEVRRLIQESTELKKILSSIIEKSK